MNYLIKKLEIMLEHLGITIEDLLSLISQWLDKLFAIWQNKLSANLAK